MKHFVIYARKSTESEDRQVLSIDSQINELQALASRLGYGELKVMRESMSAKAPGRPVFNKLMEQAESGQIAGVICWKLDRLARNPVDGGRIIWCIKSNGLRIMTPGQSYSREEDNTILMYVEFGMAQKYIDDLGKNVKRGNRTKLEMGWLPGNAPMGYMNKLDDHTVVADPERFHLVRKMWDLALTGAYSVEQIRLKANNEWNFRSRKTKRAGGKPISKGAMYNLFRNKFYCGVIERTVEGAERKYTGAHERMVTEKEFWDVQKILGNPVPKPQKHRFPLTGLIRCGECGGMVTAEEKTKVSGRHYVYYHCTKKNKTVACNQKFIVGKDLEVQVQNVLNGIHVPPAFANWAIRWLKETNRVECDDRTSAYRSLQNAYNAVQAKIDRLTDMRLGDLLTNEEYAHQKERLLQEQRQLKEKLSDTEQRADNWRERVENVFDFAVHAKDWFENGNDELKRSTAVALGSNFVLKDGILAFDCKNVWEKFSTIAPQIKRDCDRLELDENGYTDAKNTETCPVFSVWQGRGESNPR
ncbi:hypothetical protein FJZ48_00965 [Candidatus Uhrbacteria bacterium]|nr:hypothetical protein [Candidatus Uhrbacteria bacterium]